MNTDKMTKSDTGTPNAKRDYEFLCRSAYEIMTTDQSFFTSKTIDLHHHFIDELYFGGPKKLPKYVNNHNFVHPILYDIYKDTSDILKNDYPDHPIYDRQLVDRIHLRAYTFMTVLTLFSHGSSFIEDFRNYAFTRAGNAYRLLEYSDLFSYDPISKAYKYAKRHNDFSDTEMRDLRDDAGAQAACYLLIILYIQKVVSIDLPKTEKISYYLFIRVANLISTSIKMYKRFKIMENTYTKLLNKD